MKIIKLLYLKYSLCFSICLLSSFVIFFIFSLIGNLNEDYLFNIIINISILNSLQIIIYVPIFIFLISVIILLVFLRSKNEVIIMKSYLSSKDLLIFFLPIVLLFSILEINKKDFVLLVENIKTNLINQDNNLSTKIIFKEKQNSKNFIVFNNIDLNNKDRIEYRSYEVINNNIIKAEYSNNLLIKDEELIANNYTIYKNEIIKDQNFKQLLKIDFLDLINHKDIVKNNSEKNNFFENKSINFLIFSFLLMTYIFLIFFNRKYVHVKQNLVFPIIISIVFIMYSFLIFNNSLNIYKQVFELLSCVVMSMLILKIKFNE